MNQKKTPPALQIVPMSKGRSLQIDPKEWRLRASVTQGSTTVDVRSREEGDDDEVYPAELLFTSVGGVLGDEGVLIQAKLSDPTDEETIIQAISVVAGGDLLLERKVVRALPPVRI